MIEDFKILNSSLKFVDDMTGKVVAEINGITNATIETTDDNEEVSFDVVLPNGKQFKGVGTIKKGDLNKVI